MSQETNQSTNKTGVHATVTVALQKVRNHLLLMNSLKDLKKWTNQLIKPWSNYPNYTAADAKLEACACK